ncbi:Calpain-type cysteine protease DEK1 [Seminavis robusta]|uniref:Calpain-type cysteine protease DEK1 n=1 Tax=Seminavis robusta TaxID=568900 RepID=A0A9N8EDE7_9STRA|nr:Calpain-type cysteine protease DEK1 [Seminavis robusta]|eukprot:Sro1013_g231330.1 Calpain-type cysteine protease DEK1 (1108) ;mRNA; f:18698-22283
MTYSSMKISQLKALCQEQSIDTTGMLEKGEFVKALEAAATTSMEEQEEAPPPLQTISEKPYEEMKVSELRSLCGERGIDTTGMLEKGDMVQALHDNDPSPTTSSRRATAPVIPTATTASADMDESTNSQPQDRASRRASTSSTSAEPDQTTPRKSMAKRLSSRLSMKKTDMTSTVNMMDESNNSEMGDHSAQQRRASTSNNSEQSPKKSIAKRLSNRLSIKSRRQSTTDAATEPTDAAANPTSRRASVKPSQDLDVSTNSYIDESSKNRGSQRRASTAKKPSPDLDVSTNSRIDDSSKNRGFSRRASTGTPNQAPTPTRSNARRARTNSTNSASRRASEATPSDRSSKPLARDDKKPKKSLFKRSIVRKDTKRRNAVSVSRVVMEAPDLSDSAQETTDDEKKTRLSSGDEKKRVPEPLIDTAGLSDSATDDDKVRNNNNNNNTPQRSNKVSFAAATVVESDSDDSSVDQERRASLRASFLASRCNKKNPHRQRKVRFSYTADEPVEDMGHMSDSASGLDNSGLDASGGGGRRGMDDSNHSMNNGSSHQRRTSQMSGSSARRDSSTRRDSSRRSSTMRMRSPKRRSTRRSKRKSRLDERRRSTWQADNSWMDGSEAWYTQNSTNYTETDVKKAFKEAPAHKWKTDSYQVGGNYAMSVWEGELKEVRGKSIKKAIEKFKNNPHKYAALMYQTNLLHWPKSKHKYTFVMRVGEEFVTPLGVTDNKKEAWMTVLIHKYLQLPAFPNNELPQSQRDPYTQLLTFEGQTLPPPILPGRGMGICDMPSLKVIGDIDPSDIEQGEVGDCWLLCAISSLAEFDGGIKKLFRKTHALDLMPFDDGRVNKYTITLFDLETWEEVDYVIDESLSQSKKYPGHLLGAQPSVDGELWVPYLEKAFAIHCGGWDEITGGACTHAWAIMTGCKRQYSFMRDPKTDNFRCYGKYNHATKECKKQFNSPQKAKIVGNWPVSWPYIGGGGSMYQGIDEDEMFSKMCAWYGHNYMIGAGARECEELLEAEANGILADHAYSVLACFPNAAETGIDLLKIRNPWGAGEIQNGDFGDDGPGWKLFPEIRKLLKPVVADDGIFYVTKEEFFDLFDKLYLSCSNMALFKED